MQYDDMTIENKGRGFCPFVVYGFGVYPESSVLAGQTMKRFVDSFETLEDAQKAYPQARVGHRSAHNSVAHLPGPDDPVEGGAYPDDIGAEWSRG